MVRFSAKLEPIEGGTFVVIPADVVEALGATGRTSVVGTIDGHPIRHQFMPYVFEGVGRQVVMAVNKAPSRSSARASVGVRADVRVGNVDRHASAPRRP